MGTKRRKFYILVRHISSELCAFHILSVYQVVVEGGKGDYLEVVYQYLLESSSCVPSSGFLLESSSCGYQCPVFTGIFIFGGR